METRAAKVLNVNDREANRYATSRMLKAAGFDVLEAEDGESALGQARKLPDLVLLDVNLPDMSGFEVARRLREDPLTRHILILHVSAVSVLSRHRAEGLLRADGYLTEPFEAAELIGTIQALLRLGRAEASARAAARESKKAEEALRLLADAGEILMSSLDYEQTLRQVAHAAVPKLADLCLIDLREVDGTLRRLASGATDALEAQRHALQTQLPDPKQPDLIIERALFHGSATLIRSFTPEDLDRMSRSDPHREILQGLSLKSMMVIPLAVRGRIFGALTLIASVSGRHYGEDDFSVAQELARRVALALENARLHRESQTAIQTRDEFFSIASHELKNPLSALLLQLKLLQRETRRSAQNPLPLETLVKKVDAAERNATRLGELVQELLDTTRIRAGRLELRREPVDLALLIRDVAARVDSEPASTSRLKLETRQNVVGHWDRSRLEQVMTNVISNALKYSEGGDVYVSMAQQGERAEVVVRDEGIGISALDLQRIFEPFERGRTVGAGSGMTGLGLGLYIARKIVEAHGGAIVVRSAEGEGSTFTITLPLSAATEG